MRAYAIIPMQSGVPNIDLTGIGPISYTLTAHIGTWGLYLVSGAKTDLQAVNALPNVIGLAYTKENPAEGEDVWVTLDATIPAALRTKLNTWLAARGYPTIPAGTMLRAVLRAMARQMKADWEQSHYEVVD